MDKANGTTAPAAVLTTTGSPLAAVRVRQDRTCATCWGPIRRGDTCRTFSRRGRRLWVHESHDMRAVAELWGLRQNGQAAVGLLIPIALMLTLLLVAHAALAAVSAGLR